MVDAVLKAHSFMSDKSLQERYLVAYPEKGDEFAGHHAIVTAQDLIVQAVLIEELQKRFPGAKFIAEEVLPDKSLMKDVLDASSFEQAMQGEVFGIDSIDGTAQFNARKHEWSISLGYSEGLFHKFGVIYAPALKDGLFYGGINGVFVKENGTEVKYAGIKPKKDTDMVVECGVDLLQDKRFNHFINRLANDTRCLTVNGSCALGLAYVATGKSDLFVQSPQRVWDWYAGLPLVEENGGKVQFYRIDKSRIVPLELKACDYNPSRKDLGFVAGHPAAVDKFFNMLKDMYNAG